MNGIPWWIIVIYFVGLLLILAAVVMMFVVALTYGGWLWLSPLGPLGILALYIWIET